MVAHVDPHSVQTTPFCFTGGVGKLSLSKAGQSRVIIPQQVGDYSFYINKKTLLVLKRMRYSFVILNLVFTVHQWKNDLVSLTEAPG